MTLMHCIFRKKNLSWLGCIIITLMMVLLSACQPKPTVIKCSPQQRCIDDITSRLNRYNVAVIRTGETVSIHIPARQIFNENTANFAGNYHIILDLVADLVLQYETELVKVGAHTDACSDPNRSIAVTTQQAENIVHYLTNAGVEARVLYAAGYGQAKPVASFDSIDHYKNQRIEIVFRFIPRQVDREDYEY